MDNNFVLRHDAESDSVIYIPGVFTCPNCQEDLREVGVWEARDVTEYTVMAFNEDSGRFEEDHSDSGVHPDSFTVNCNGCDGKLPPEQVDAISHLIG